MNFDFFAKLDRSGQLLFVFLCLAFIITIALFMRWLIIEISTFFKGKKISVGSVNITDSYGALNSSENNLRQDIKDIVELLQVQQQVLLDIYKIKDIEILKEQMAYAENKVELCYNLAEKSFCNLLENNKVSNYLASTEYASYCVYLLLVKEKILSKIRHMCKENGFIEKSEEDFQQYIKDYTILITDMLLFLAKSYYPYRNSIVNFNSQIEKVHPEVKRTIADVILKARDISRLKQREIDALWQRFNDSYQQIIGRNPMRWFL